MLTTRPTSSSYRNQTPRNRNSDSFIYTAYICFNKIEIYGYARIPPPPFTFSQVLAGIGSCKKFLEFLTGAKIGFQIVFKTGMFVKKCAIELKGCFGIEFVKKKCAIVLKGCFGIEFVTKTVKSS
jgi:hypothetical protein